MAGMEKRLPEGEGVLSGYGPATFLTGRAGAGCRLPVEASHTSMMRVYAAILCKRREKPGAGAGESPGGILPRRSGDLTRFGNPSWRHRRFRADPAFGE
jgi:hypothetical protein